MGPASLANMDQRHSASCIEKKENEKSRRGGGMTSYEMYKLATLSGLFYYFYNEVAFLALSEVTPSTGGVQKTGPKNFSGAHEKCAKLR